MRNPGNPHIEWKLHFDQRTNRREGEEGKNARVSGCARFLFLTFYQCKNFGALLIYFSDLFDDIYLHNLLRHVWKVPKHF